MGDSPPGSPVYRISQARTFEWAAFPSPGEHPEPEIEPIYPALPALAGGFFTTESAGRPFSTRMGGKRLHRLIDTKVT